jgi:hypothetical protein
MDTDDPKERLHCFSVRRIIFMSIKNIEGRMLEERMRLREMRGEDWNQNWKKKKKITGDT